MITYKLHLIRHGLTDVSGHGVYAGRRTDLPISAQGRARLQAFGAHCGYPQAQKVYTSPLLRCTQTAELIYPEAWLQRLDGLAECDFGAFDGKQVGELKHDPAFGAWVNSGLRAAPPGGESAEQLEARVCAALEAMFADMMKNKLSSCAAITHGGIVALLMAKYSVPREKKMADWMCADGCGYTVLMTPQTWMRDGGFELYEEIPFRVNAFLRLGPEAFHRELEQWNKKKEATT